MTGPRFTDDDTRWLEMLQARQEPAPHACGRCKTPYGRSALPCPNDPNNPRRLT